MHERRVPMEGCFNFRDLGGYITSDGRVVRWGTLFRSDSVHHLTDADVAHARQIGIRTVVDLRTDIEREGHPAGPLEAIVDTHHISLINPAPIDRRDVPVVSLRPGTDRSPEATAERYLFVMHSAGPGLVRALSVIAGGCPAVFCCAAGKDRTGVLAAIVLGALGVPDEVIVEDYVLTGEYIEPVIARLRASSVYEANMDDSGFGYEPHAETMQMVLRTIDDEYGSIAGYLREQGASGELFDRLRETLLS